MRDYKETVEEIIQSMKEQKTYSKSYTNTINVLARTLCDYDKAIETFEKTGGNLIISHTNKVGATNIVKNPIYLAIEKLRSDIVIFSRELGLSPASKKQEGKLIDEANDLMRFISE